MNPRMITDPDLEVTNMVNSSTDYRRQVAEDRAVMRRMDREQAQRRKKVKWQELRMAVYETGACVAMAVGVYAAYWQGLVAAQLAVPIVVASLIFAGIRVDRFFRR